MSSLIGNNKAINIEIPHLIKNRLVFLRILRDTIKLHDGRPVTLRQEEQQPLIQSISDLDDFLKSIEVHQTELPAGLIRSFENIRDDYSFFQAHSTEAEQAIEAMSPFISNVLTPKTPIDFLDFGCGDGHFTQSLFQSLNPTSACLNLHLIDIDQTSLADAKGRLEGYSKSPITAAKLIPTHSTRKFDFILANHSLYYVSALGKTLASFEKALKRGGTILLNLATKRNDLFVLNNTFYQMHGKDYPKILAEEVESALKCLGYKYRVRIISSVLLFSDSMENRKKMVNFLNIGTVYSLTKQSKMIELFDRYKKGPKIQMNLECNLFVVAKE